jgi:anti-sigma factor RsiW
VSHQDVQLLLSAYLDGEIEPAEAAGVEAHVATCDACRAEVESLRETMDALASLASIEAPDGFVQQVQSTIRRRSRERFYGQRTPRDSGFRVPYDVVAVSMLVVLASIAVTMIPSVKAPPPPRLATIGVDASVAEPAGYRVRAKGADPATVRRLAREAGATAVHAYQGTGFAIDLPPGAATRFVDRLNFVSPIDVERFPPGGTHDRVEISF